MMKYTSQATLVLIGLLATCTSAAVWGLPAVLDTIGTTEVGNFVKDFNNGACLAF